LKRERTKIIDEIIMDSDNILDQTMKVSSGEKSPTTAKVDNVIPFFMKDIQLE
jgi:hypothetical protein